MRSDLPLVRRIAVAAVVALSIGVLIATLAGGLAPSYPVKVMQLIATTLAAIVVIGVVMNFVTNRLADYTDPEDEEEFELLVQRSERLARENLAAEPDEGEFLELDPYDREDFDTLVREALDDLPDLLIKALDRVPVVVSDKGRQAGAYGLYQGDTVARDNYHDRIIIFRDTLLRDFGHHPDLLRAQVTRTVRPELAHHLGADELGVRELGL